MDAQSRLNMWGIFYASIVSMKLHPGNYARGEEGKVLLECAEIADMMLREYERRS